MKLFKALLLTVGAISTTSAWTTRASSPTNLQKFFTNTRSASTSTSLSMASRNAEKLASRSAWAESKGMVEGTLEEASSDLCTVIGAGRIGSLLSQGGKSLVLKRGDSISDDEDLVGTPIFIATRNDSLDPIVEACPDNRKADLVFLQNGYLDGFLESKQLEKNTQALLYLSVPALGVEPVDGVTAVNPEGLTSATGIHAQALADRLGALGLKCQVVEEAEYKPAMFEKLIWISTYMLVGTAKECTSVGQAGADHADLVQSVVSELCVAVSAKEDITFAEGSMERLAAYTDVVADFPCAVKEFEWRNEYFYKLGDDACPIHNGLLRECKEKGFLGFELS